MATHSAELLYNATRDPHKVVSGASAPAAAEWCPGRELHSGEGALRRGPGQMVVVSISPQAVASIAHANEISATEVAAHIRSYPSRSLSILRLARMAGQCNELRSRRRRRACWLASCAALALPGCYPRTTRRGALFARLVRAPLPFLGVRPEAPVALAVRLIPAPLAQEMSSASSGALERPVGQGSGPPVPGGGRCWQASVRAL